MRRGLRALCQAAVFVAALHASEGAAVAEPSEVTFTSPSGNVVCSLHTGLMDASVAGAACDVSERDYAAPAGAVGCEHGGGLRFILGQGDAAQVHCHHDTLRVPGMPTLGYGRSASLGTITCRSTEAGVACADGATGHGFVVSRQAYHLN